MILCLTPNPAIDRTLYLETLRPGEVQRAGNVLVAAGGKGLNVARAIRTLGGNPLCMGLIGGHAGNLLADLAKGEGLAAYWTQTRSETRTCIILVQPNQDSTVINEPGNALDLEECKTFIEDVWRQSSLSSLVCVCGSLPPGFPLNQFELMLVGLVARGKDVWVDTSGLALKTALGVKGINLKVNVAELSEALGLQISNTKQALNAARELCMTGIGQVVITLGKAGAILVSSNESWVAHSPEIKVVSSVGSGDSFLGGLAFALANGFPPEIALNYAVGAGSANALHIGGGVFSYGEFEKIYQNIKL